MSCIFDISSDTIIGVFATIIAIIALGISIWQGIVTRNHNKLSVKPILHFTSGPLPYENDGNIVYQISIGNDGLGPAIIKSYKILYDSVEITSKEYGIHQASLISLAADKATYKENIKREINGTSLGKGSIILPNNSIRLLSFRFVELDSIKRENIITNLYNIDIEIIYTSIYQGKNQKIKLIEKKTPKYPPLTQENINELRKKFASEGKKPAANNGYK
ncbi:hypothetical protein [Aequorivita marisscotiae]|uniref:Uncharacterized protein n=1 Tax=Aequorivita marisscotiae TaxID=3040348 RepID=A0ABY8L208_9FLAO|nr:hypothetical protein [Aequorivita sp. Ant34-E75]WGF93987.1 hypothetical protein QCQ61_07295 [Aequorivita sp. Ant34-E75]